MFVFWKVLRLFPKFNSTFFFKKNLPIIYTQYYHERITYKSTTKHLKKKVQLVNNETQKV